MKYTLILMTLLLQSIALLGQYDIQYDSTFGVNGITNLNFSIVAEKGAFLQSDGKILLMAEKRITYDAGNFLRIRLNPDGTLDETFGNSGVNSSTPYFDKVNPEPKGIMLQNDEFIVLGAAKPTNYLYDKFLLHKYKVDGDLDTQFGNGGTTTIQIDSLNMSCLSFQLYNDTSLLMLVKGSYENQGTYYYRAFIYKLNINGKIDSSFATNGRLELPSPAIYSTQNMAVGPEGNIYLLEGVSSPQTEAVTSSLMKINPDLSFTELFHLTDTSGKISIEQIFTDDDGKIILASSKYNSKYYLIWRLMPNGILDTSFDRDGLLEGIFHTIIGSFNQLVEQPDGKLLLCLQGGAIGMRINPNGTVDYSFDLDGLAEIIGMQDINFNYLASSGLELQPDGKIIFVTEDENNLIKVIRVKTRP